MIASAIQIALALTLSTSVQIHDVYGRPVDRFHTEGKAAVLIFLSAECPISRFYAPEIQRICGTYASKGVSCELVYEDADLDAAAIRKHLEEFSYRGIPAVLDVKAAIAKQTGASITPQAVVLDDRGAIRYRGRIDNFYADLGKPRRQVTIHDLRDTLDALLAGKRVLQPETEAVGCYISQ